MTLSFPKNLVTKCFYLPDTVIAIYINHTFAVHKEE